MGTDADKYASRPRQIEGYPAAVMTRFNSPETRFPGTDLYSILETMTDSDEYRTFLAIYGATTHINELLLHRSATQKERVGMFVNSLRQHCRGIGVKEDITKNLLRMDLWEDVGVFNPQGTHFCYVPCSRGYYNWRSNRHHYSHARRRIADLTPDEFQRIEGTHMQLDQIEMLARLAKERAEMTPELEMKQSFANAQAALSSMKTLASEAETINGQAELVVNRLCAIAETLA